MSDKQQAHKKVLLKALGGTLPAAGTRIGLFGGSFNPAHSGHLAISVEALKALRLHELWWLVSPQNPLKSRTDMAEFEERLEGARNLVQDPRIRVLDLEARLGICLTADTLEILKRLLPEARFVWIMGADNLAQIDQWHGWEEIFYMTPIAIFNRPGYGHRALTSAAARHFASARLPAAEAFRLVSTPPPAWVFLHHTKLPLSASQIRAQRKAEREEREKALRKD